jgi:hypothetical protein
MPRFEQIYHSVKTIESLVSSHDTDTLAETIGHQLVKLRGLESSHGTSEAFQKLQIRKQLNKVLKSAKVMYRHESNKSSWKYMRHENGSASDDVQSNDEQHGSNATSCSTAGISTLQKRFSYCVEVCRTTTATDPSATYVKLPRDPEK